MGLYTKLVTNIIFPLHERLKKHDTVRIREDMEKTQWLSTQELKALQTEPF